MAHARQPAMPSSPAVVPICCVVAAAPEKLLFTGVGLRGSVLASLEPAILPVLFRLGSRSEFSQLTAVAAGFLIRPR